MTKKRGLGKGLGALIPSQQELDPTGEASPGLQMALVSAIQPNPHQPRSRMEEDSLQDLANSILEHGLIQPLIVQEGEDGQFTLIAGERRWRASQLAGLERVPVVIKEASPQEMLELALIENIQRADLNPLEEAHAFRQLIEDFGLTQSQVARRVGKSRPAVANTLRLLNLPANIQQAVTDRLLSEGHARTLLSLTDGQEQTLVMRQIINQGLSVRQTEALVQVLLLDLPVNARRALLREQISSSHAQLLEGLPEGQAQAVLDSIINNKLSVAQAERLVDMLMSDAKPDSIRKARKEPELLSLEAQFQEHLGFQVNIQQGAKGGRVVIHFYSDEDLQTIYDAIIRGNE